ncbi:hypothetical protein ST37_02240 (plasmid) [Vibrio sp. qd031]|nr:hypothetical protein ST37_02240 [Vibrio sp. qd031]
MDDVIVVDGGNRVDMRSVSRVSRSDQGAKRYLVVMVEFSASIWMTSSLLLSCWSVAPAKGRLDLTTPLRD